jgi:cyclophilin family peptidyl-prolyl cis-trans isomerase
MVKKGKRKHSNECQFYITLTTLKSFDNMFVAFGRVIKGFKTIKEIENVETSLQRPTSLIKITKCGEYLV